MTPDAELDALVARYDPEVFAPARAARVRLVVDGVPARDALLADGGLSLAPVAGRANAELAGSAEAWRGVATDPGGGMQAFRRGRIRVRQDLHLAVGFLAATGGVAGEGRLRLHTVPTRSGRIAVLEAGAPAAARPLLAVHGLGATMASFLPTVGALARTRRVVAMDLPGFGDSGKPLGAAYDPPFFARAVVELLDALELERADLVGNSLGGRVALEVGLEHPERVGRLALLAPSLAWWHRPWWAGLLRYARPELALGAQLPRPLVEAVLERTVPGRGEGWVAAGVDEFLRSALTPRGRVAFLAAARQIALEPAEGPRGFWPRLAGLRAPALFVWGRRDRLVPVAFADHVRRVLPSAEHLVLDGGHVPQLESPRAVHAAIERFLSEGG